MEDVNYIKHLNAVFNQFSKDSRLNPTHISLYIALFQLWNLNRFLEEFFVNRDEVMQLSKIGSKSTYHRCIKELNHWKYIVYFPSHNPYRGSKIKMLKFGTSFGQVVGHNNTQIETDFNDSENDSKQNSSVPNMDNLKTTKNKNYNEPL